MCYLEVRKYVPTLGLVEDAARRNQDGTTLFKGKDFYVLHARLGTGGSREDLHPFRIPDTKYLLWHNGVLTNYGTQEKSDTKCLSEEMAGWELARIKQHLLGLHNLKNGNFVVGSVNNYWLIGKFVNNPLQTRFASNSMLDENLNNQACLKSSTTDAAKVGSVIRLAEPVKRLPYQTLWEPRQTGKTYPYAPSSWAKPDKDEPQSPCSTCLGSKDRGYQWECGRCDNYDNYWKWEDGDVYTN
jgi:hypothetical protein